MILDFDLPPGSRITEQELADQFKVSRTPIREALQRLATEDYLAIRPKQGCFIRPVDIEAIAEHYDVRVALESMTVELACKNMSDADLQKLAYFWHPENHNLNLDSTEHVSLTEESFHIQIAEGSGNRTLVEYLKDVNDRIRIIRRLGFPDETSVLETCQEHYEICQLLLKRKPKLAREAIVKHIRKSQDIARAVTLSQIEQYQKQTRLRRKGAA
jgi:DNA-binding GntR family transcriptional regulator